MLKESYESCILVVNYMLWLFPPCSLNMLSLETFGNDKNEIANEHAQQHFATVDPVQYSLYFGAVIQLISLIDRPSRIRAVMKSMIFFNRGNLGIR